MTTSMKKNLFILLTAIAFVACSNDENEMSLPNMVSPIPRSELTAEVKEFFDAEMGRSYVFSWMSIPFNTVNLKTVGDSIPPYACQIINSHEELATIYTGKMELPEIDFMAYSLVLGCFRGNDTSWSLNRIIIQENEEELLLTAYLQIDKSPDHYFELAIIHLPFWNLYPKLPDKPLQVWVHKE